MKVRGSLPAVQALQDAGIKKVFGIPGTHNIELWDALQDSETIEPVLVTHECGAAFMADGLARSSDQIGVLVIVPGAGVTHALSGIAESMMDNIPMVILACGIRADTGTAYQLHAIDQLAVLRPVTKAAWRVENPGDIYSMIRRAVMEARSGCPGPVAVEIPADFFMVTQSIEKPEPLTVPDVDHLPDREVLERAARMVTESNQPALYIGKGAEGAADLLIRLAEKLGAPVVTTFQGKGVFPESHPLSLWTGFGAQAPPFVQHVMDDCDLLLAIGCRFSEVATGSYGLDLPEKLIHVDISAEVLGRNYPADLVACCDSRAFVDGLLSLIEGERPWGPLARTVAEGHGRVNEKWVGLRAGEGTITAAELFSGLQRHCRSDAIFTTDSGNGTFLAAEHLRLDGPGRFLAPVDFSCMGYSIPAAIGAAMAHPGRDVVAIPGDGAFLMTCMELLTAGAYRATPLICILRDGKLGQIAQFQKIPLNRETCSVLPDYSVAGIAQAVGASFFRIVSRSELETVLPAALELTRHGTVAIVEVMLDTSHKTYFTKGVVKTNFWRLSWGDRLRMLGRALARRLM